MLESLCWKAYCRACRRMGSNLDDLLAWFWLDLKGKSRHFYDAALFWRNRILAQESVTHTREVTNLLNPGT
jgi:hypothetical protein